MESWAAFGQSWVQAFWFILVESGLWLLVGFALAGVVHALVPAGLIEKQLSGRGLKPIAKASLLGIPLPLCSCSVIPVAAGLRRGGASRGASAAFAISTPQTGEESIPLTWALFGPVFAIARPIVAVVTAFTAGLAIQTFGDEREAKGEAPKGCCNAGADAKPEPEPAAASGSCCGSAVPKDVALPMASCCSGGGPVAAESAEVQGGACCSSGSGNPEFESVLDRIGRAFRHGFITMPVDLAPWLTLGLVLAAVISAAMPEDWIATHVGSGLVPMLAMLVIGVPLYICATSSTPLAFTLVAAGLSPGAALVLLLAGPATNVATISWALKDLGARATIIYLVTIAAVSLACGLAFDAMFSGALRLAEAGIGHEMSHGPLFEGGAVALLLVLLVALVVRGMRAVGPMVTARPAHG